MKSVLAFDLGRVLFDYDFDLALDKMAEHISATKDQIIRDMFYNDFAADFERGLVSGQEFHSKFAAAYNAAIKYEEFVPIWNDIFTPMPEMIDLVRRLQPDYPLYLISNINQLHWEFLNQGYPDVFKLFRKLILSCEVKAIKPERKIYEALRVAAGCEFQDIIYIDDRQDLVQEASRLNLQCVRFSGIDRLKADFHAKGIIV